MAPKYWFTWACYILRARWLMARHIIPSVKPTTSDQQNNITYFSSSNLWTAHYYINNIAQLINEQWTLQPMDEDSLFSRANGWRPGCGSSYAPPLPTPPPPTLLLPLCSGCSRPPSPPPWPLPTPTSKSDTSYGDLRGSASGGRQRFRPPSFQLELVQKRAWA